MNLQWNKLPLNRLDYSHTSIYFTYRRTDINNPTLELKHHTDQLPTAASDFLQSIHLAFKSTTRSQTKPSFYQPKYVQKSSNARKAPYKTPQCISG